MSLTTFLAAAVLALAGSASANNALNVNTNHQNQKFVQIAITEWGSDFYFAIMSALGASAFAMMVMSFKKPRSDRIFFYLCAGLCSVATIAYFSMGSNLGWTPIDVEWVRNTPAGRNREIFYVRYIDWFITTPMLLMDLMLTAGLPWPTILYTILLDEIMVVTGLVGALVKSRYKWGFYSFGCVAMFAVFYELAFVGRRSAKALGDDVHKVFVRCGVLTLFLWMLYPVSWGLCEGGNVITPNDEAVFYGCLDLIAKPVFSFMLLAGHWNIDPERLGLKIRDPEEFAQSMRKRNDEKAIGNGANGVTNGERPSDYGEAA